MRERKRKHDDAHRPLSGSGRRARKIAPNTAPKARLVPAVFWVTDPGVTPNSCNHASWNLKTVAESYGPGVNYETVECHKCCVRKQYRISPSGYRKLVRAVAIRRSS